MNGLRCVHPASDEVHSQGRLNVAINRLLAVVVVQSHFLEHVHVSGISAKVGIRIFSIVGGLGFLSGQIRGSVRWRRGGRGLRLLHRLKRPEGSWVRAKSLKSLVGGIIKRGQCRVKVSFLQGTRGPKEGAFVEMPGLRVRGQKLL